MVVPSDGTLIELIECLPCTVPRAVRAFSRLLLPTLSSQVDVERPGLSVWSEVTQLVSG